jgi:hypothetical protein
MEAGKRVEEFVRRKVKSLLADVAMIGPDQFPRENGGTAGHRRETFGRLGLGQSPSKASILPFFGFVIA